MMILALTWGGIAYQWDDIHVVLPLVLAPLGLLVFFVYEARWAKEPVLPPVLLGNRTSALG